MLERLTGQPTAPFDPLPIPKEMRLGHALCHGNPELALRICETRPLTDTDIRDLEQHYIRNDQCSLLDAGCSEALRIMQIWHACILDHALEQFPHLLTAPWMRFAVASTALALPTPHDDLQRWVARMEDGDIPMRSLPTYLQRGLFTANGWFPNTDLDELFFSRWDERLGRRLTPAIDLNGDLFPENLSPESIREILDRVHFTGEGSPDKLLVSIPVDMLPELLHPGGLLTREDPKVLLDACQELPPSRRNILLPHLRKEVDYTL